MNSQELSQWIAERKGYCSAVQTRLEGVDTDLERTRSKLEHLISARELLNTFIQRKQQDIIDACCGLGTLMLQSIYGEEYKLDLRFEEKRNKSEASLVVLKGDIELSLDDETGGGIVDVVALAMRFALWSLMEPRTDPIFLMDEPARFVSKDKLPLFGEMLRTICGRLGIQVIMVSHEEELMNIADVAYRIEINNGVSKILGGGL